LALLQEVELTLAKGFAPPKRFRAKGDLRRILEINFRYLATYLNATFGLPAYTPPFVPYAPRIWRGTGDLLPVLNRNWRYTVSYVNDFVNAEPTLAGIKGFAPYPPFRGDEAEVAVMLAKNWQKFVTWLNGDIAPLL
jgi:hypothetical protein